MFSVHFTNHIAYLLLFPLGFFLLWRQYQNKGMERGNRFVKPLLLTLQSLALLLMVLSLAAPEIIHQQVVFHRPAILLLKDQSESFLNGKYLGLEQNYQSFEQKLTAYAKENNFEVRIEDFEEPAKLSYGKSIRRQGSGVYATPPVNLKGVFVFSDGRVIGESASSVSSFIANLDAPIFPVKLDSNGLIEIQATKVLLNFDRSPVNIELHYNTIGPLPSRAKIKLIASSKLLFEESFPVLSKTGVHHFNWSPSKNWINNTEPVYAVLQQELESSNFNPWNDTTVVQIVGTKGRSTIFVLKPVYSLDEKALFDILNQSGDFNLEFFELKELSSLRLTEKDQVWMELNILGSNSLEMLEKVKGWIEKTPTKLVFYAGPLFQEESLKKKNIPNALGKLIQVGLIPKTEWKPFTVSASISGKVKAGPDRKKSANSFPDEIVRVKDMSSLSITAMGIDASLVPLVEVKEGDKQGVVFGKFTLGSGKQILVFTLPAIWNEIFNAQVDYLTHRRISGLVKSIGNLAESWMDNKIITSPLPFNDSLSSVAKKRIELSKIGFNEKLLADWAHRSGGTIVTSVLPKLSNEEAKEDKMHSYRFFNSVPVFFMILFLLSTAWALRKKWDLD